MRNQARRDTAAELAIRRELWRRGLRYRVDVAPTSGLRRRADIVFTRARVAVYVDGCFWHRCPIHGTMPKANHEWWRAKLDGNVERDRDTDRSLADAGWLVIRIWEHEDPVDAASRIEAAVRRPTGGPLSRTRRDLRSG
jgi:DNA mismatch endonuclease (patch repair protein)